MQSKLILSVLLSAALLSACSSPPTLSQPKGSPVPVNTATFIGGAHVS